MTTKPKVCFCKKELIEDPRNNQIKERKQDRCRVEGSDLNMLLWLDQP